MEFLRLFHHIGKQPRDGKKQQRFQTEQVCKHPAGAVCLTVENREHQHRHARCGNETGGRRADTVEDLIDIAVFPERLQKRCND